MVDPQTAKDLQTLEQVIGMLHGSYVTYPNLLLAIKIVHISERDMDYPVTRV